MHTLTTRQHILTTALVALIALVFGAFVLTFSESTRAHFAFAGGDGGGGGGAGDACGAPGPAGATGATGSCGVGGTGSSGSGGSGGNGGGDGGGESGGRSCSTFPCISAANVCGDVSTGVQNSCTNICSASVPANPSGSCSVATACGVDATGYNGCGGHCNITEYPFCLSVQNPEGDTNDIEWITIGNDTDEEYGVTDVVVEIYARPNIVVRDNPTVIRWISLETDSCEVTAPNGDSWSGAVGEELTSDITERTTYTITCEGFDGTDVTDTVVVNIVPEWEEF